MCPKIFNLNFFHDSNPSRPLINRLKYFLILFRFWRDIQIFKKLRGVHHTAESSCALCMPPWSQAPRCASHHRVKWSKFFKKLRSVHPTAESTPRCASHHWVRLRGVLLTAESDSAVCITQLSQAPGYASYRRVWLRSVHPTNESVLTKCLFWFKVLQMQFLSDAWRY